MRTHLRRHGWTIRFNPCYRSTFRLDRLGLLIVTERWIIAYGPCARAWM